MERSNLGGLNLLSISRVTSSKVTLGNVTLQVFFYPTTSQLDSSVNRMNKLGCDHFIALLSNNDVNGFASNSLLQCQSSIQNVDLVAYFRSDHMLIFSVL